MRIHKEGGSTLIIVSLFLLIVNVLLFTFLPLPQWLMIAIIIISFSFFLFIVSFFRNPKRKTIATEMEIVAPADGKVVVIEEVMEEEYFHLVRKQVSIFMSPANVHVNRNPVGGEVKYIKHHPGKYLVAWHPKSSTENERTTLVIGNQHGDLLIRQIAGILARRIVNYLKVGDNVKQGEEFGFIKFGSRVDVFLPVNAEMVVKLNQFVRGGETVIAKILI